MNGYLVLARCSIDDIPLRLFHNKSAAVAYAQTVTQAEVFKVAREVFTLDTSQVIVIDVVQFEDGIPTDVEMAAEFEEDA